MRWYDSADYKAAKNLRHSSATSRVILVEVVQAAYNRNRSSPIDPDWGAGRSLTSLPGIGPFFTVLQRYEVDDMTRFRSAKKFACYTGSSPLHASNTRVYHSTLTKQGEQVATVAFIEAVGPAPPGPELASPLLW